MHHFCGVLPFLVTTKKFPTEPNKLCCVWMIAHLFGVDFDYACSYQLYSKHLHILMDIFDYLLQTYSSLVLKYNA